MSHETFPNISHTYQKTLVAGRELSNEVGESRQLNDRPRYMFSISLGNMSPSDHDTWVSFVITHYGFSGSSSASAFNFDDVDDNSVSDVQFGTGDGSTTKFQLKNKYTSGSESEKFPEDHIQPGTETIKNAGSTTTAYSLDDDTGVITFDSAPADGNSLTASFDFYRLCMFRGNQFTSGVPNSARRDSSIEIKEVRG